MKRTLLLFFCVCTLGLRAEIVTLDLTQPTNPSVIGFTDEDIWTETYNDAADYNALEFQVFSFFHLTSGNSWGGTYWEGFSVSKVSADTLNYNSCMAKGGLAGEGTPYIIAYYADFMEGLNAVVFNDGKPYYPQRVAVCQNPVTYRCVTEGYAMARKFGEGDYLTLIIQAMDENYEVDKDRAVVYYLADCRAGDEKDWTVNRMWESVDLSSLGACYGLMFTMQSTDSSDWGINTATCFALDGLAVSDVETSVSTPVPSDAVVEWNVYDIAGHCLLTSVATLDELRRSLPKGVYVVRSGEYALKIAR